MTQTRRIDLMVTSPKALEHSSTALTATGAAGGDDGDRPPDGNHWNPDKVPLPDLTLVPDPVQKCLQQKRRLLRILRMKRLWAIKTGQTTLARILSDRIMVIEADLLDLERSDPATIHPGLVKTWLAENSREISLYRVIASGKYYGRQTCNGEKDQPSGTTKASTTTTTSQNRQMSEVPACNQGTGSSGGSGRGGDDPLKPSAEQDNENLVVTCSNCEKTLNTQEISRIANEESASAFLCNTCLSGTNGKKRARRSSEETQLHDSSEPAQKKNKGSCRKRNNSKAVAPTPAKKKKRADTRISDDPLEKVKEKILYELTEEELEKVQTLMQVFKKKNITAKYTFYNLLGFVERKSFNGFFDNAIVFFRHLPETIKNTGMLTGMLKNIKKHTRDFAERSQSELKYLASLDVLTSFSSMNNGKGVPKPEEMKEVLGWPEWKDKGGKFSTELFRSLSSMYAKRGMPGHEEVREMLGWSEWKDKNNEFSIELFRCFTSMNHGRGMLRHEEVKEVLGWPEWKDKDGEFSMKRFRAFSSMNHTKGMLKHEKVKAVLSWPEWKDKDGKFNMQLFHSFSSMYNTNGVPKHEEMKEVLSWSEWRDKNGEFSMECFRAFSCMNNGQGMLKYKEVKEVLGWPEWKDKDGDFSIERFRAFSSMNHCQGVPKHDQVKKVLDWTRCRGTTNHLLLQIMTKLWKSESLPAIKMLQHQETQLKQWLFTKFTEGNGDSDSEEDDEYNSDSEDDKFNRQIKTVALYLSTSKPDLSLSWAVLKQFLKIHENTKTVLMLKPLIRLLSSYGGKGVERYLRADRQDRNFLLHHSSKSLPLHVLDKAMVLFSASEHRSRFVYFVKRLKSLPDKSLWEHYSARLQALSGVLKLKYMQRLYLKILQPLTKDDQLRFLEASRAQAVFDLFPSLSALHKLS
ncbi:hypothetical protein, partial [Endozoicomonas sp. ONNA1]|uniref:hypothetical protein n=1 Tax=Endozoicomonas sp. ONNA1 TaxID=2828740 RepID=UPI002147C346